MRSMAVMTMVAAALAGCVATPMPVESTSITYETHPCFGACPVYSVTVTPDGQGTFTGTRFTAVTGERGFTLSREAYGRLRSRWRPIGRKAAGCVTRWDRKNAARRLRISRAWT